MVRQRHQLFLSRDIDGQKIPESDWLQGTPSHTETRVSLKCQLPLMIISWLFPAFLLIKKSFNLIGRKTQQATTNQKVVVSGVTFLNNFLHVKKLRS